MMGRQTGDQSQLFYIFNLEERIPANHLLRRINLIVTRVLADLREKLAPFYSDIGRPSIDPELMIRMLIVGYCYGIRFERRLCGEVELHLALQMVLPARSRRQGSDHSTFSVNRHGRFRDSDILRHVFESVVRACMDAGLVKGEGFAVDASVIEADASRYHGKAPDEFDWSLPKRQTRAVAEFLTALDDDDPTADRKLPTVISPVDPCSAWTAKAAVAFYILWSGWRLMKDSVGGLMDEAVPPETLARIREIISTNADGAIEAHDLRTRPHDVHRFPSCRAEQHERGGRTRCLRPPGACHQGRVPRCAHFHSCRAPTRDEVKRGSASGGE